MNEEALAHWGGGGLMGQMKENKSSIFPIVSILLIAGLLLKVPRVVFYHVCLLSSVSVHSAPLISSAASHEIQRPVSHIRHVSFYTANPRITRLIRSEKSSRNTKTRKVNNL